MKSTWTVAKREIFSLFVSPLAYVMLTSWTLWSGCTLFLLAWEFAVRPIGSSGSQETPLTAFFGGTVLFYLPLLVYVPLITMRLLAEEKSRGTLEVLLTAPVRDGAVLFGKYAAALFFWVVLWLPTLFYVWIISRYGGVDLGSVASAYVGILGIGLYYLAIGVFMSSVANTPVVAGVLTFATLFGLFLLGLGELVFGSEYRAVFAYISVLGHMEAFGRGVVDSRHLVFDVSVAVLFLLMTSTRLALRRAEL